MKHSDDKLSRDLQLWKVDAAACPDFQERVWRRIAQNANASEPATGWLSQIKALFRMLHEPRAAFATAVILIGLNFGFGYAVAARQHGGLEQASLQLYAQSVDPYAQVRTAR